MKYLYLLLVINFWACSDENKKTATDVPPGKVRLRVDDKIINRGDIDEIMLPLTWWVGVTDSEQLYLQGLQRFSNDQRIVYAMRAYIKEAAEQGHYQFFNSTNRLVWEDALLGLSSVGLKEHFNILQRAISKKATGKLEDVDFEDEDVDLLNLNESVSPEKATLAYIRAHRKSYYYEEIVTKP